MYSLVFRQLVFGNGTFGVKTLKSIFENVRLNRSNVYANVEMVLTENLTEIIGHLQSKIT